MSSSVSGLVSNANTTLATMRVSGHPGRLWGDKLRKRGISGVSGQGLPPVFPAANRPLGDELRSVIAVLTALPVPVCDQ